MWAELIGHWGGGIELRTPAREADIQVAETRVGSALPRALRGFLGESDGLSGKYGIDVVWDAATIGEENSSLRRDPSLRDLYQPFDSLLFFGDNGGGDQFAFDMGSGGEEVLVWDHETDERRVVADSLESYVVRTLQADGGDWYR